VSGRCRYIISGDNDLLEVGSYRKVKIVTPRAFVDAVLE
jgi:predicted nucleic acid-binding protein